MERSLEKGDYPLGKMALRKEDIMRKKCAVVLMFVLILTARDGHSQKIKNAEVFRETKSKDGVVVRIEIPKLKHTVLQPIVLQMVVTNKSSKQIVLVKDSVIELSKAEIVDTKRKRKVPLTLHGQRFVKRKGIPSSPSLITIGPGKDYVLTINLTRIFDLSLSSDYAVSCNLSYFRGREEFSLKVDNLSFSVNEKPN